MALPSRFTNPVKMLRPVGAVLHANEVPVSLPEPWVGDSALLVGAFGGIRRSISPSSCRIAGFDFDDTLVRIVR